MGRGSAPLSRVAVKGASCVNLSGVEANKHMVKRKLVEFKHYFLFAPKIYMLGWG
jgi:hypothetical protein